MRIVCISDTHKQHRGLDLPEGDILVHAGDMTMDGRVKDVIDAFSWLADQRFRRIIVTPGNHDLSFQRGRKLRDRLHLEFPRVEVLIDDSTIVDEVVLHASPWQPWFNNWAYNFRPGFEGEEDARRRWQMIPDDASILVTHGPVRDILDRTPEDDHVGCESLRERISDLPKLRLHICGHIHDSYGTLRVGDVLYVNASSCDERYQLSNAPIVVDRDAEGFFHQVRPSR